MFEEYPEIEKWFQRLIGASSIMGAAYATYYGISEVQIPVLGFVIDAAIGAFGAAILITLVSIPFAFILFAATAVTDVQNPFFQGVAFIWCLMIGCAAIDLLLFQGEFVLFPLIMLITSGDISQTYWGCSNYVIIEEGSYCND